MKRLTAIVTVLLLISVGIAQNSDGADLSKHWKKPSDDILKIVHAPKLPWTYTSPSGKYLLLTDPISYPPLSELAAPMLKLAGIRVNPANNYYHSRNSHRSGVLSTLRVLQGSLRLYA